MLGGQLQVVDMRSAGTPIGNNQYTFPFLDKSVEEF
jgi:hypothetical protein